MTDRLARAIALRMVSTAVLEAAHAASERANAALADLDRLQHAFGRAHQAVVLAACDMTPAELADFNAWVQRGQPDINLATTGQQSN